MYHSAVSALNFARIPLLRFQGFSGNSAQIQDLALNSGLFKGRSFSTTSSFSGLSSTKPLLSKNLCTSKLIVIFAKTMSTKKVIVPEDSPKALGPYSPAISANGFIFTSGQLGVDPKTGEFASQEVEGQTEKALVNLGNVLKAGGATYDDVVKVTVLLKDINDFAKVNAVYSKFFQKDPPARACYAVAALPKNALIELEAIAVQPK